MTIKFLAGVDEVGRGCLAGPVMSAAIILNNKIDKNFPENRFKNTIEINDSYFKIPKLLLEPNSKNFSNTKIREALTFNKNLLIKNFILPYRLKLPFSRNILEKYYN